jgi:hypothetical protein
MGASVSDAMTNGSGIQRSAMFTKKPVILLSMRAAYLK